MEFAGNTIIKTCANREQEITVGDCHICCICTMHTEISDKKRMSGGNGTTSHNCSNDWYLSLFYNRGKDVIGICNIDTAACQKKRFFCFL